MAKMSRLQLKSLIKECVVEVLIEGLNPNVEEDLMQESKRAAPRSKKSTASRSKTSRPSLDKISFGKRVTESVNVCTEDPVMASIFEDTARTTLQEQLGDEKSASHNRQVAVNGDPASQIAAENDPTDMFGEAANNWAALAFNEV